MNLEEVSRYSDEATGFMIQGSVHGSYKRFFSYPESSDPSGGVRASCSTSNGGSFSELKRSVREAKHSPASAKVKN